jgi:F-type H+-transporting ATPase subunit delta
MATFNDKELALARVYSNAMLQLADAKGEADSLLEELLDLSAYLDKNAELDAFFSSPTVDTGARERSTEKIFRGRASELLVDSLQVLNRNGRLDLLRAIAETYRLAHRELRGLVEVQVRTAVPLTDELRASIKDLFGKYTGKDAVLVEGLDESVIGGMVVQVGDRKFDTSVASRLKKLNDSLLERASHEIHGGKSYVTEAAG